MTERAQYSHISPRESGPIVRTVYVDLPYGPIVVAFHGEEPYVLSYPSGDRRAYLDRMRRAQVNADHAWALALDQRRTVRMVGTKAYVVEDSK